MTESILNTIKQMLGIPVADTSFDQDILAHINSAFMVLHQLGVGPTTVYSIEDDTAKWVDFLTDPTAYSPVKTYIYLKVRLAFDPPGTSFLLSAIDAQIKEWEWRLMVQVPIPPEPVVPVE
jgi:hypothetical protein